MNSRPSYKHDGSTPPDEKYSFTVPKPLDDEVRAYAKAHTLTLSAAARELLGFGLERNGARMSGDGAAAPSPQEHGKGGQGALTVFVPEHLREGYARLVTRLGLSAAALVQICVGKYLHLVLKALEEASESP